MNRIVRSGAVAVAVASALVVVARPVPGSRADEPVGRDIPPAFSSLEYLVGQWTGQAVPKDSAQSFRGWTEAHSWAWIFTKGRPTGMSVAIRDGKVLADGRLSFDPAGKRYRLEGTAAMPRGGPIAFEGALDGSGKLLVLEQVGTEKGRGQIRLSMRPNSNFIRYTMAVDRKQPGESRFNPSIVVGLTRFGESLAGGSSTSDGPRCIVTGGTATMTISYNGQTFPICCTGCRDEFNENPEKYIKKASLMAKSRGSEGKARGPSPSRVSRFEDAFAGDVADAPAVKAGGRSAGAAMKSARATKVREESDESSDASEASSADASKAAARKNEPKTAASSPAARAAGLLRIARNLERSGKTEAALKEYKRIVKDFAETPVAKTAKQRIKALEKP
jgi:YHS domain-containing protein